MHLAIPNMALVVSANDRSMFAIGVLTRAREVIVVVCSHHLVL
jgi:hypothetical protein